MDIEIDFSFIIVNDDAPNFSNNLIYELGKTIADALENSGFGEIINEEENGVFVNERIRPFVTAFVGEDRREYFIGYLLPIRETSENSNENDGNLSRLLLEEIPLLIQNINNQYPELIIFIRNSYHRHE